MNRLRHTLNRLRLRCGLFRWRNYGHIWSKTNTHKTVWMSWFRPPPGRFMPAVECESHKQAIRYIRRSIRQGVRT